MPVRPESETPGFQETQFLGGEADLQPEEDHVRKIAMDLLVSGIEDPDDIPKALELLEDPTVYREFKVIISLAEQFDNEMTAIDPTWERIIPLPSSAENPRS